MVEQSREVGAMVRSPAIHEVRLDQRRRCLRCNAKGRALPSSCGLVAFCGRTCHGGRMSTRDRLLLLLLAAVWGSSFLFMRVAAPELGAFVLIEIRLLVAAIVLLVWLALRGGLSTLRCNFGKLAVLGAVNSAIPFTLFAFATLSLTAGMASVLNATTPLWAAVVGFFWLRDRLAPQKLLGLAIGFAGVIVLVAHKLGDTKDLVAVLAGLLAAGCYGVSSHFTRLRCVGLPPMTIAAGSLLAASLLLLPFALATLPTEWPSFRALVGAIVLGVVCTGLAYVWYFRLLASVGPARAITVTYLVPVFGVLWGVVFLAESFTWSMVLGAAVVLTGTMLVVSGPRIEQPIH